MISQQVRAIVWAQWRSLANHRSRKTSSRLPIVVIFAVVWYGFWAFVAASLAVTVADPENLPLVTRVFPAGLLAIAIYWQIVPIIMVSSGVSLDLMKLLAYPIPHAELFSIEVVLRVTTCVEMLLLSAGLCVGILLNPQLPAWGVLSVIVFAFFNLLLSAGLKDLLGRLLARRGVREVVVFLIVLLAALPQLLLVAEPGEGTARWTDAATGSYTPWGAAGRVATSLHWGAAGMLAAWTLAAWAFARSQFERTLRFDTAEARARKTKPNSRLQPMVNALFGFVSRLAPDPLGALIEKEIRFLSRSPRFRLLFLMGFSFGLLIWLPMTLRDGENSFLQSNYLTFVSAYSLMLLGEVCFWNNFGLDRGAAQNYFTMPVSMSTVLYAKNIVALIFILLELSLVSLSCVLLRMPVSANAVAEAFAVTLVFAAFLLSFGNLISVRYPRPVDPNQSWRSGSVNRAQAYLLFLYPAAAAPVALAFAAEFAFDSKVAFYGVLLLDLLIAGVVYAIARESAIQTMETNKEFILLTLSKSDNPAAS